MSTQQVQRCVSEVLALDERTEIDWSQGQYKKLFNATSVLYRASLNKVVLKSDEETARAHICAIIACQKCVEKQSPGDPPLHYYFDRVPLEPRKIRTLLDVFRQNLSQCSPVKQIQWSPSPRKYAARRGPASRSNSGSPLKKNESFTAQDPQQLRRLLFPSSPPRSEEGTPVPYAPKGDTPSADVDSGSPVVRRKLAFEDEIEDEDVETDDNLDSESATPNLGFLTGLDAGRKVGKKRGRRPTHRSHIALANIKKKFARINSAEIIDLCNRFELPRDVTYSIIEQYTELAGYLVSAWQLLCGLVLHGVYVVFSEKRKRDPRIDHLLLKKMMFMMQTDNLEEVILCYTLVQELVVGQKWYRALQVKYNYFDGFGYEETLSKKLGSMLQSDKMLFTDEQYENWRRKVQQDMSLRDE
ncbi:origin recognition complex subunit 6 KNAG_0H03540 [Huiozyma naganishii CBS 8797]|uniref:ORC6 first cyclin-like domain-containing protein n=1 Tax=Huiozyma naganishii (strain ATCC MYA-139 / BCRC 22969 / CBS 8797 / KCTC 17520 / NBRC 10181 / NCYC 3082 / Yp74L-3) TaxID=1071383 RepID=J7RPU4_HUIN7|nr:hypothetical protein KNAG_0H03540 [Kazachstania naganishii CBS 8797]CCK71768.1 hypothetical protein KNAG_0H03540 [Kazachstania naganishii CBS 8797]